MRHIRRARLSRLLVAASLALAAVGAPVIAQAALADDPARDPRCADWEAHGAPPGVNLDLACAPSAAAAPAEVDTGDLASEKLLPYTIALTVTGLALGAVGVISLRVSGPRAQANRRRSAAARFWSCGTCDATNPVDRASCYACQSTRTSAVEVPAPTV
jgi:hypothetical protein